MTRQHLRKAHISLRFVSILGYRMLPEHRRLRNDNGHRFVRKLRRLALGYAQERLTWDDIESWIGHAKQADTMGLRKKIFSGIVVPTGTDLIDPGVWCAAAPGTTNRRLRVGL